MEVLGLIPARGGSKSIPHKNLVRLGGQTLVGCACQQAKASKKITRLIMSTDDRRIAAEAKKNGAEVPFLRPKRLSSDTAGMSDVILHALAWLRDHEEYEPDAVALLQPTSPFRTAAHIDAAVALLKKTGADTVVSVVPVPHQFSPSSVMDISAGRLVPHEPLSQKVLRRQEKPKSYARNGPAILVLRVSSFLKTRQFYSGDVRPYVMDPRESLDIDTPFDLALAKFLLKKS